MAATSYSEDRPTMVGGPTLTDTWRVLPGRAKRWFAARPDDGDDAVAADSPDAARGVDHMPFLRTIWAEPLNPQPLVRYADWLDSIGLGGAAAYYRRKAADVVTGRSEPEFPERPDWLMDWD